MKPEIPVNNVTLLSHSSFCVTKATITHQISAPRAAGLLDQARTVCTHANDSAPDKPRRKRFRLQRVCAAGMVLALATFQTLLASSPATQTVLQGLNIEQIGQWPGYSRGFARGLVVQNDLAYVAGGTGGLIIINVSNPAAPARVGGYDTSGSAYGIALSGNYAYVADGYAGLQVIDVSNPAAPAIVGGYDTRGFAYGVALSGNYAYVADGPWDLAVLRLGESAAEAPQIVTQPQSQTVGAGASVFFSIKTIGSQPLTYQWFKDGVVLADNDRINGAISSALTILDVQAEDAGQYHLVVSNALGSVASQSATLTVRAPVPGELRWEFATGGVVYSSPAIGADGTVYVGSGNKLFAIDGATGTKKWDFTTGDFVTSSPAIGADGTVYVSSKDSKVYSLDGTTGAKKWALTTGGWVYSSPAIGSDGMVYIGSWDGKFHALDGATGAKKWEFATGENVACSPAIGADGTVYMDSYIKLYALDGATGVKKWDFAFDGEAHSSPAIGADGTIYVGSDNKLIALESATGAKKWEFATSADIRSSPAIGSDGTVYMGSYNGKVYALDGATGVKKWEFATGWVVYSSPAISADGTVYVGSRDNKFYALDGATGTKKWDYATGWVVDSSPAIGTDGTVYVGSSDGKLYAFFGSAPLAQSAWPMRGHDARHTGNVAFSEPLPLRFRDWSIEGGEFKVQVAGAPGQKIVIEASDDLRNWTPVRTNTLSALGLMDLAEPLSPNLSQQFYRLRAQ